MTLASVEGRLVVVTGAAGGLGEALAVEAAAREAASIAIIDVDEAAAQDVAARISASGTPTQAFTCDISDVDAISSLADKIVATLGVPGLVCANAGVNPDPTPLLSAEPADFAWTMSVNVAGTWATLRAFGTHLTENDRDGWLLVTASEHALGVPFAGNGLYTASKHAILGMTDVIRQELPPHVGISTMVPGLIATRLWNSGSLRPELYGGALPAQDFTKALIARGLAAETVAQRALDGVASGRFLVATHPHAIKYAEVRHTDIVEAFAELDASGVPESSYDVTEVATALLSEMS